MHKGCHQLDGGGGWARALLPRPLSANPCLVPRWSGWLLGYEGMYLLQTSLKWGVIQYSYELGSEDLTSY